MVTRCLAAVVIAGLVASHSLYASVEVEFSAGQSTKTIEGDEGESNSSLKSTDFSLYAGYRWKNIISFGLTATQKSYDLDDAAQDLSPVADAFYSNPDIFTSGPATQSSKESSGSLKGLVYGPQLTFAYPGKYFQPYLRLSYQMGDLRTQAKYSSRSDYLNNDVAFEVQVKDKQQASFTQVGLGFRVPIKKAYVFCDVAMETMNYTSESSELSYGAVINDEEFRNTEVSSEKTKDAAGGSLLKLGVGMDL